MAIFSHPATRVILRISVAVCGTALAALAILVVSRILVHSPRAEAASIIYYPNFCLGGWKYPQHASGAAASAGPFKAENFTLQNSAFLESSVASQMFCGYFSVQDAKNPPTKAVITFNWSFAFDDTASTTEKILEEEIEELKPEEEVPLEEQQSYTNLDPNGPVISPDTGFTVTATSSAPEEEAEPKKNPSEAHTGNGSDTTVIPVIPETQQTDPNDGPSDAPDTSADQSVQPAGSTPPASSDSSSAPAAASSHESPAESSPQSSSADAAPSSDAPSSSDAPASDAPQSNGMRESISRMIASLIAERVQAAEVAEQLPAPDSFKDFLEVSYSFDGIRWTAIGRVNRDNWKNFSIEVPVTSWDEVKRLQIMVSVLPTIDQKPDIYLDNMSMRAEYKQTLAELAAQGFAAVTDAVDGLIGFGNDELAGFDVVPEEKKAPQPVVIYKKKLLFSENGNAISRTEETKVDGEVKSRKIRSEEFSFDLSEDRASLTVSGTCSKKYFVVLTYRNPSDYQKKVSSFIANEAHECTSGRFTFDLGSLSPDLKGGDQYLLIGEQEEMGPWTPVSDLYPITIDATTTVERIFPNQN